MVDDAQRPDRRAYRRAGVPTHELPEKGASGLVQGVQVASTGAFSPSASDILKLVGDGVISTDALGKILVFNRAAEEIFGYAQSEVLGGSIDMLIPERFRRTHFKDVERFLMTLRQGPG